STIPKDARWEAMLSVFDGKEPLFIHASNIQQIRSAIDYCSKENLRMVLVGGTDAWRISPLLKDKDIPVVLDRVNALPAREEEDYDAGYTLPKKLFDAGIRFCLSDDGSWPQRNLPFQAATAIGFGLPEDAALRAVTLSTAEIMGVADRLGSLDVGKDANIVISTGDLLDIQTNNVVQEFIQGRNVDLNNKQKDLYHKYEEKYSRYK
ncbi:MAG TPA: amidohydrolase family protein, partial [Candidatus Kapabacteria bacterium]|nr:amidohydrolase family protein [Candidatus Kapabacteria bacterium]